MGIRNSMYPVCSIYSSPELGIYKGIHTIKRGNKKGMGMGLITKIQKVYKEYKELGNGEGSELQLTISIIVLLWILLTHVV